MVGEQAPRPAVRLPDAGDGLRLLGHFSLVRRGVDLELAPTEQRLVALLALRGPLTRTQAWGRLWPDADDAHAGAGLRSVLWRLRRVDADLIPAAGDHLRLDPALPVDVARLAALAARDADVSADLVPVGELLPGFDDDWIVSERPRLLDLQLHVLHAAGERMLAAGRHGPALECAHAALRLDPLRETAHRLVMRVHLDEGNVAQAARCYDAYAALLKAELGLHPSELMRSLLQQ